MKKSDYHLRMRIGGKEKSNWNFREVKDKTKVWNKFVKMKLYQIMNLIVNNSYF